MQTVTALEFRKKFGEILDLINHNETVLITRQNIPLGIIYPFKNKRPEIEEEKRKEAAKKLIQELREWRKKWGKRQKGEKDSVALIREMRENRYGKRYFVTGSHY